MPPSTEIFAMSNEINIYREGNVIMIDTMYISYRLDKARYDFLFSSINDLSIQISGKKLFKDRKDKNAFVTYSLHESGYPEIKLRWYHGYVDYRAIEIKVRPKLVIEKDNYYDLIQLNEIDKFRKAFNEYFGKYYLPDLLHWNVKRIDYAIDLNISQELIPIYMLLFKKANLPFYALFNNITQEYMDSKTNLYLYSKNITINFYDRFSTLIDKEMKCNKEWKAIDVVNSKLRLEIQLKNCKGKLNHFLNLENYKKTLQENYDLVIGDGDYYLLSESLNIITKCTKNMRQNIILKDFVKQIDSLGGIWKAKEKFVQGLIGKEREKALKKFSSLLNKVRKVGINPVSLKDEYGLIMLQNLKPQINEEFSRIEKQFDNSYDSTISIREVV
jgi:hypothetical protein